MLLLGASGVFSELQTDFNVIWRAENRSRAGLKGWIIGRLLAFAAVLGIGLLLLVSLLASALVAGFARRLGSVLPAPSLILQAGEFLLFLAAITVAVAFLFRLLPDAPVRWKEVWVGAGLTAFLFSLGKLLIGLYLGRSSTASSYGAAASFVVLLFWIYYSAQILFVGAELTEIYMGRRTGPRTHAIARRTR